MSLFAKVVIDVQRIKAQFPEPAEVAHQAPKSAIVAYQMARVSAWHAQADGMLCVARERAQCGATGVANALAEWAERMKDDASELERRWGSTEHKYMAGHSAH